MPTLHAGHAVCRSCGGIGEKKDRYGDIWPCNPCGTSGRTDEFHKIKLTDGQMIALGFQKKAKHTKLGCGMDACAYDVPGSDSVVKVTKDVRDAVAADVLRRLDPVPLWAIPIRAVYRLEGRIFVIVVARAQIPLPEEWAAPIWKIFKDTSDEKKWGKDGLLAEEWNTRLGYDGWMDNIKLANIRHGENQERRHLKRALDTINEMMLALRELGLDGSDFHEKNWGMYQGRPVLIDFGMARLKDKKGHAIPGRVALPDPDSIPVLPF